MSGNGMSNNGTRNRMGMGMGMGRGMGNGNVLRDAVRDETMRNCGMRHGRGTAGGTV